jgi:hypothetical protein
MSIVVRGCILRHTWIPRKRDLPAREIALRDTVIEASGFCNRMIWTKSGDDFRFKPTGETAFISTRPHKYILGGPSEFGRKRSLLGRGDGGIK